MKKFLKKELESYQNIQGTKPILFVSDLYKKYPRKKRAAINQISFNVYPGQFHAFIGSNGAGKTTTIKTLISAYINWSGTVLINGYKNDTQNAKKHLGYIPEIARFPNHMSTKRYLMWMGRLSGINKRQVQEIIRNYLVKFNMWNLRRASPNTFSSGQKKKILLIQALLHDPDILIMDEPAANLDPKARIEFFDCLINLTKQGKAVFVSSHILNEIDKYADSVTILDGGKIIFTGSIKDLYQQHSKKAFVLRCQNNELLDHFLHEHKVDYTFDKKDQCFVFDQISSELKKEIIHYLDSQKIDLLEFKEVHTDLNEIYARLTKLGSVDTMKVANE